MKDDIFGDTIPIKPTLEESYICISISEPAVSCPQSNEIDFDKMIAPLIKKEVERILKEKGLIDD